MAEYAAGVFLFVGPDAIAKDEIQVSVKAIKPLPPTFML